MATEFKKTSSQEKSLQALQDMDMTWGDFWNNFKMGVREKDARSWFKTFLNITGVCFFLYFFLFSLDLMGTSFKVIGGCSAGGLFDSISNPIAGLLIGVLATVLVQSSSTSTSIVVSLVGAGSMSVQTAIPVIMGANIGTSITNTIVACGQINDKTQFERAFAGATVHDMFNILSVCVILPLELITGFLYRMTSAMVPNEVEDGEKWVGPIKKIVSPLANRILYANKNVIKDVSLGGSCEAIYADPEESGLIKCGETLKGQAFCPLFYQENATQSEDIAAGFVCLFISLFLLCACLYGLVKLLQKMVMGTSEKMLKKATTLHPLLGMLVGVGITILVQSSSITTSVLTPLVGLGVIDLESMFVMTLGANIGTTCTSLLASLVSDNPDAVQIALCHLFFNITGILIWYPLPFMRRVPLNAARFLGKMAARFTTFPFWYIMSVFIIIPFILLAVSSLYTAGGAWEVLGVILTVFLVLAICRYIYFLKKENGWSKIMLHFEKREARTVLFKNLPVVVKELEIQINELQGKTGIKVREIAHLQRIKTGVKMGAGDKAAISTAHSTRSNSKDSPVYSEVEEPVQLADTVAAPSGHINMYVKNSPTKKGSPNDVEMTVKP